MYHIGKSGKPAICRAKKGNCPLGGADTHFDSKEACQEQINKLSEGKFGITGGVETKAAKSKATKSKTDKNTAELKIVDSDNSKIFDTNKNWVPDTLAGKGRIKNYDDFSLDYASCLTVIQKDAEDPPKDKAKKLIAEKKFAELRDFLAERRLMEQKVNRVNEGLLWHKDSDPNDYKPLEDYKDNTAAIAEEIMKCDAYTPLQTYPEGANIGAAYMSGTDTPFDPNWHLRKYESIDEVDINNTLFLEFLSEETSKDGKKYEGESLIKEKTEVDKDAREKIEEGIVKLKDKKSGAFYRDQVWGDYLANEYNEKLKADNSSYRVVSNKNQYRSKKYEWAEVNIDGVITDKDGDIKQLLVVKRSNGSWGDKLPEEVRVEALHKLEVTELPEATVICSYGNSSPRAYQIKRGEVISDEDPRKITEIYPKIDRIWDKIKEYKNRQ